MGKVLIDVDCSGAISLGVRSSTVRLTNTRQYKKQVWSTEHRSQHQVRRNHSKHKGKAGMLFQRCLRWRFATSLEGFLPEMPDPCRSTRSTSILGGSSSKVRRRWCNTGGVTEPKWTRAESRFASAGCSSRWRSATPIGRASGRL